MPNNYFEVNIAILVLKFLLTDVGSAFVIFGKEPYAHLYQERKSLLYLSTKLHDVAFQTQRYSCIPPR